MLPLLDHVLVADGTETVGAGVGVEAAPVATLHRVLLHLVRLLVHVRLLQMSVRAIPKAETRIYKLESI